MKVFIDGAEGTTGLQLERRLSALKDIELVKLGEDKRKDPEARRESLNSADIAFLCLPDAASREAVAMVENDSTVIIDASTAHRTAAGWAYGFPELSPEHYRAVRDGRRISVPGCHASGFCAIVYPLIKAGLLRPEERLYCHSLTGYSGGGKSMIARYEGPERPSGAKPYALGLQHKHLPEMAHVCGLTKPPIFMPVVVPVRQGMIVSVPLDLDADIVRNCFEAHYSGGGQVRVVTNPTPDSLDMDSLNGTDILELFVFGGDGCIAAARLDNLGKGASGAALRCLEIKMEEL